MKETKSLLKGPIKRRIELERDDIIHLLFIAGEISPEEFESCDINVSIVDTTIKVSIEEQN